MLQINNPCFCGKQIKSEKTMSFSTTSVRKLEVASPVPADIDIANSIQPIHISHIATDLNLTPNHYDLYGKYKAKVSNFVYLFTYYLFSILLDRIYIHNCIK